MAIAWKATRVRTPLTADKFPATNTAGIDRNLIIGSVFFGIGWGLAGLCPGPAIASLSFGGSSGVIFASAMIIGMLSTRRFQAFFHKAENLTKTITWRFEPTPKYHLYTVIIKPIRSIFKASFASCYKFRKTNVKKNIYLTSVFPWITCDDRSYRARRRHQMKKIFIIAFALIGTVFLAGCETAAPESVMVTPEASSNKL